MSRTKLLIAMAILIVVAFCGYLYFAGTNESKYTDITDLDGEYNIDDALVDAERKLDSDLQPAQIYVDAADKGTIALTFDGLPDPTTTDRLLDLLDKYQVKATFFVDGSTAAKDNESLKKIYQRKYDIGNYTYAGVAELDKLPPEEILTQLLKTQKVIEVTTGTASDIFKAPRTTYTEDLLKTAAAAGLKAAVKTNVYVAPDTITSDEDAKIFVDKVVPGSIVSLPIATPVNRVKYEPGKTDERPAFDKQPGLRVDINADNKHQDIVDVTERILKALQNRSLSTENVTGFRLVTQLQAPNTKLSFQELAPTTGIVQTFTKKIGVLADALFFQKAFAAAEDYQTLRQNNNGIKTTPVSMILTTEPAVCFSFAGLSKPSVVYDILERLKTMNATGTFFVMKNDIDKNPQLVQSIIDSGNEVGIGIRSLKNADFYSTCAEIDYVQNKLQEMGATPRLAMQPWGRIEDDTREAVSAMGLTLMGSTISAVKSSMKEYTSPQQVMQELFGKYVYSLGRGWIVYFRLDYYQDDTLAGKVMDLIKRDKINNIAYNSFYDDPKINPHNDSSYAIQSLGAVFYNQAYRYKFATEDRVPERLRSSQNPLLNEHIDFKNYIKKRYIGNPAIDADSNTLGFSIAQLHTIDTVGQIHTDKPVIFFTFDDWGTDASINKLLYVLRKHRAHANFFVLTHNVLNNPNLLRSIAEEGHDIGAHSDMHKPMTTQNVRNNMMRPSVQSKEEYMQDLASCYQKLETVTGDVAIDGHPALTRYFRPPQLTISKMGFECLYANGFSYIIDGSYSTHDYDQTNLRGMMSSIRAAIFDENGKVKNGAILVMHMSDSGEYTAVALDMLLTANDQRQNGDPAKFTPARLSDYLKDGYDASNPAFDKDLSSSVNYDKYLYKNSGYNIGDEQSE